MKKILFLLALLICALNIKAKTLIAYYSYTGNCKAILTEIKSQITADMLEIQPAEEGLNYAANNFNLSKKQALIQTCLKTTDYATISATETPSTMTITINNHDLIVDLVSNSSTEALLALLKEAPITYEAHDYGNFEKVGDIGHTLPQNNEDITTVPGDVILYLGKNICIYYDTNEWDFTRLGKIRDVTQSELKQILGDGNVTVRLSLGETSGVNLVKADNSKSRQTYSIDGKALNTQPANGVYIDNGIKKTAGHRDSLRKETR